MTHTNNLSQMLRDNERFVDNRGYEHYQTTKFPDKRMVILACMDTRLVELLEKSMGIEQGHAIVVRVAGAQIRHPFGSVMQSILIAIHMLGAEEVVVVGHHDCGMQCVDKQAFVEKLMERGISAKTIETVENAGIRLDQWLEQFDNVHDSVRATVATVVSHPFLAESGIPVHGLVIDPQTGKLDLVCNGYDHALLPEEVL